MNLRKQLDQEIQTAIENLDMGFLKESYQKLIQAKEQNQISSQEFHVFEAIFESAAETIEELQ